MKDHIKETAGLPGIDLTQIQKAQLALSEAIARDLYPKYVEMFKRFPQLKAKLLTRKDKIKKWIRNLFGRTPR